MSGSASRQRALASRRSSASWIGAAAPGQEKVELMGRGVVSSGTLRREARRHMARRLISSGSTFEKQIGYSRAVVDGEWLFVSGTTGFDYKSMTISNDIAEQTE